MSNPLPIEIKLREVVRRGVLRVAFALLTAATLAGCRSVQPAQSTWSTDASASAPAERFEQLAKTYGDWSYVSMPVRLSITSPKAFSVTAQCEMKKNGWIQFSVRILGIEAAKMWIDNDSIHAIDKYHRRYLSESLQRFLGSNDVTIGNLQDLLLGRAFVTGRSGGTLSSDMQRRVNLVPSAQGLMILPAVEPTDFNYGFILDNDANCVAASSVTVGDRYAMVANYSTYYDTPAGAVTSATSVRSVKGTPVDFSLTWNLQSAKWNQQQNRSWSTPSGYSRMPAEDILKLLSTF